MKALLVRVGVDSSCGNWNGPVKSETGEFVYVPIPEDYKLRPRMTRPYSELEHSLIKVGSQIPGWLARRVMHLDPDFSALTYGDGRQRAIQINTKLCPNDLIVFYAGLRDVNTRKLIYAMIGLLTVEKIKRAIDVPPREWPLNAHTRRVLSQGSNGDIVVFGQKKLSGRLARCLQIGSYRNRAYRVFPKLLSAWGGLSVKDGYLQRSARLPEFLDAKKFYSWFRKKNVALLNRNN